MALFSDYHFAGQRALIRVDFNVPLDKQTLAITDDTRIRASLPTVRAILNAGGSVILMSYLGRPKEGPEHKYSLKHILPHLTSLLNEAGSPAVPVHFANDCIGKEANDKADALKPGEVLLLENLRFYKEEEKATDIIIGGGMAYTFMRAEGGETGNSLCEEDRLDTALEILKKAEEKNVCIHLPSDSVIADRFAADAQTSAAPSNNIPDGWMGLDIGANACDQFSNVIRRSKTILWNGPMGVFEMHNFQHGTKMIAVAVAEATAEGAFSLVGGGDSVAAVNQFGFTNKVSYVSTGGGAMLEFFEGKTLPGIAAVKD